MLSWVLRTGGYIIIHWSVCVCVWKYYSFSTHGLAMRLLLLEGCAWTHECPNFTPLFEGFLEDWKPENHPVYNIFYWWISHQIYRQLKLKLKERSLTLFLHSQTAMSEVIYFFFTVMTSYCGSYSRKISAEFYPICPTVVRRALLYWHKLCFCQFSNHKPVYTCPYYIITDIHEFLRRYFVYAGV